MRRPMLQVNRLVASSTEIDGEDELSVLILVFDCPRGAANLTVKSFEFMVRRCQLRHKRYFLSGSKCIASAEANVLL